MANMFEEIRRVTAEHARLQDDIRSTLEAQRAAYAAVGSQLTFQFSSLKIQDALIRSSWTQQAEILRTLEPWGKTLQGIQEQYRSLHLGLNEVFSRSDFITQAMKEIDGRWHATRNEYQAAISRDTAYWRRIVDELTASVSTWRLPEWQVNLTGTIVSEGEEISSDEIQLAAKDVLASLSKSPDIKRGIPEALAILLARIPGAAGRLIWMIIVSYMVGILANITTPYWQAKIGDLNSQEKRAIIKTVEENLNSQLPDTDLGNYRVVTASTLNARSAPAKASPTTGRMYFGQIVRVVRNKRHWTEVEYFDNATLETEQAWVFTRYIKRLRHRNRPKPSIARGGHRAIALDLYKSGQATLSQAAKVADLSLEAFIELLGQAGVSAVDYPPDELAEEIENAR